MRLQYYEFQKLQNIHTQTCYWFFFSFFDPHSGTTLNLHEFTFLYTQSTNSLLFIGTNLQFLLFYDQTSKFFEISANFLWKLHVYYTVNNNSIDANIRIFDTSFHRIELYAWNFYLLYIKNNNYPFIGNGYFIADISACQVAPSLSSIYIYTVIIQSST